LPGTDVPSGATIGGAAFETAGSIPGIEEGGAASAPPAGTGSTGPVAPASAIGAGCAGGGGGGMSAGAVSGSSCSKITPEISRSIICLISGETASSTAFFASTVAASLSFLASMSASWNNGVDML
jgi:hypothetical protein